MKEKYDPQPNGKPILCLDFDGCIHSYTSGWKGVDKIPDPPVPGAFEWMTRAAEVFEIHIYSSRSSSPAGRRAMFQYIYSRDRVLAHLVVFADEKPRAFITIDDRCVQFNGNWSDAQFQPQKLLAFVPYYKVVK